MTVLQEMSGDLSAILYNPTNKPIIAVVTINGEGARWQ